MLRSALSTREPELFGQSTICPRSQMRHSLSIDQTIRRWRRSVSFSKADFFFFPETLDPEIIGPVVTFDDIPGGSWWNEAYQGSIYFSPMDGDLVKIPIPDA